MFERPHHQRIAQLLQALDGNCLRSYQCLFGGGTAIALRYGEYRESVDVDFLVSDINAYRQLRQLIREADSLAPLFHGGNAFFTLAKDIRADQYGIRTTVNVFDTLIKFEIVFEARIKLDAPGKNDVVCGIPTLTVVDLAAGKLLANSDRGLDEGVFCRDIIDLAMMNLPLRALRQASAKAEQAYGSAVLADLHKVINHLVDKPALLDRCISAMAVTVPKALLWKRIRALKRLQPAAPHDTSTIQ